jgi:Holliday junction DNA helicase RuvA
VIARLSGQLADKQPNRLVVDVHGVGYELAVPLSTFYQLPEPGNTVSLHVHTHVREDALALFGFATPLELAIFQRLIAVNGIGPRLALAVLSGIEPAEFVRAVQGGDVQRLTAIPGIGRKTSERICLELKDRLPEVGTSEAGAGGGPAAGLRGDLLSALLNLGYGRGAIEPVLDRVLASPGPEGFERRLKQALRELAG